MNMMINPLQHFMESGKLRFLPDAYMPLDEWKKMFRAHCEQNNLGTVKLHKNNLIPVLFDYQGQLIKDPHYARVYPRGPSGNDGPRIRCTEWCIGMEPVEGLSSSAADRSGSVGALFA